MAQALVKGARADGEVTSDDGNLKLKLGLPKSMGGPGKYTNPEQLFAAGYAGTSHEHYRTLDHNK